MPRRIAEVYRRSFSGLPREVWLLAAVSFVNRAGSMVLPFLALYLVVEHGCEPGEVGWVLSLYGIGAIAGSFLGGALCDRIGVRAVQVTSLVANGLGLFVFGALETRTAITVAAPLLGLVTELFRPANAAAFAAASAPDDRVRAFALQRFAINLGMAAGPTVGGFLAVRDYTWLFVIDGATCLAAAFLLLGVRTTAARGTGASAGTSAGRSPARDPAFLAVCVLMLALSCVLFQLLSTWPLFLRENYGLAEDDIGLLFGLNTLGVALFEMVAVHLLRGRRPLPVVALGALLFCGSFALLPLGSGLAWAAVTVGVWTAGEILSMPLSAGFVADRAGPARIGGYMGYFTMSFSAAFVIAPAAGTLVYERFGPNVLWYGCGAVGLALFAGFRVLERRLRHQARETMSAAEISH